MNGVRGITALPMATRTKTACTESAVKSDLFRREKKKKLLKKVWRVPQSKVSIVPPHHTGYISTTHAQGCYDDTILLLHVCLHHCNTTIGLNTRHSSADNWLFWGERANIAYTTVLTLLSHRFLYRILYVVCLWPSGVACKNVTWWKRSRLLEKLH